MGTQTSINPESNQSVSLDPKSNRPAPAPAPDPEANRPAPAELDLSDHEEYFHLPPPLARQGGSAGKFFID
jgi:hypothetical protein